MTDNIAEVANDDYQFVVSARNNEVVLKDRDSDLTLTMTPVFADRLGRTFQEMARQAASGSAMALVNGPGGD